MACMKLGSKPDAFRQQGQSWFCTTGLPSDLTVEVGDMMFHLHKFPLLSKSGLLEKQIKENSDKEEATVIKLHDLPGGAQAFELVVRFCYGVKLELDSSNVVRLALCFRAPSNDRGDGRRQLDCSDRNLLQPGCRSQLERFDEGTPNMQ
ncbi:unnamed protein product [Musa textilis]